MTTTYFSHWDWKHGDVSRRPIVRIRIIGVQIIENPLYRCYVREDIKGSIYTLGTVHYKNLFCVVQILATVLVVQWARWMLPSHWVVAGLQCSIWSLLGSAICLSSMDVSAVGNVRRDCKRPMVCRWSPPTKIILTGCCIKTHLAASEAWCSLSAGSIGFVMARPPSLTGSKSISFLRSPGVALQVSAGWVFFSVCFLGL